MRQIFVIMLLVICWSGLAVAESKLELSEDTFNFGKFAQRKAVTHTFWLKSAGPDTLIIKNVDAGCSCTKAPLMDSVLAPGDSTSLKITFNSGRMRGYINKRPTIYTNDPLAQNKELKLFSEIIPDTTSFRPLTFSAFLIDVSQFSELTRRVAKFHIINMSDEDYNIQIVDTSMKSFDVEMPRKIKARETVEATVVVHKDKVDSEFEESFTFQIDDFDNTVYSVPIQRRLRFK